MADDKVVYIDNRHRSLSQQARSRLAETLQRVQERAVARLQLAVAQSMDQADDALFALANKAETGDQQDLYFDAMREVRLKRKGLEQHFRQELERSFRRFVADPYMLARRGGEQARAEGLSLVGDDELEEQLAFEAMAGKARKRHGLPLAHLQVRLGWLAGDTKLAEVPTPLGPLTICEAFRSAAAGIELDIRVRLVLLKLFDKHVLGELGELYHDLNALLIDAGILPELRTAVASDRAERPAAERAEEKPAGRGDELFNLMRQLLAKHQEAPQPGPAGGSAPLYSMTDLVSALSAIQQQHASTLLPGAPTPALGSDKLRAQLSGRLPALAGDAGAIGALESDVLDVVGLLFDFILDDPNLLPPVKVLLSRLQIPFIKVALLDRGFFNKRSHPARLLLNALAQAGLEWSDDGGPAQDRWLAEMERIVERVLTEFEQKMSLFEELLREFEAFQAEEHRRADLIEERTRQAAEGKARSEAARKRVASELNARRSGQPLPEAVQTLVDQGWSRLLSITYLREGPESAVWQHQIETLDRLIWSVQPKASMAERQELLGAIPRLLESLRLGLASISYDPVELDRLFKELEQCHLSALRARPSAAQPAPPPPAVEKAPAAPVSEPPDANVSLESVKALHAGAWLELRGEDGLLRRAKLSARFPGEAGERLLFVNHNGMKVAERGALQLARELRDGDARLLDERQLFDRTLEAVVASLRDQGPSKI